MVQTYPLLALQLFASSVVFAQQRVVPRTAEPTPFIPGQVFAKKAAAPQPTSPPQVLRKALLARDAATCGWMMADGKPNVCGENQYCFTSASGEFGIWNCCNPGSCYTATGCTKDKECAGDTNYCVTSFMSNSGTTFSRFMCGTTSSIVSMAYSREDTPQYTASQLSASQASEIAASLASASRAAQQSSTGTTTASVPASSTAASSPAEASSEVPTPGSKKSGLSTGALVGIIIAVVVIIALLGAIAFFIWRKKNNAVAAHPTPTAAEMSGAPLMSGGPVEHYKPHAYPDTYAHHAQGGPVGVGVQQYPAELDGPPSYAQPVVHEMPTNVPAK